VRILVAFGTRPEIIKLAPVCRALQRTGVDLDVFWSGQHIELAVGLLELFNIAATYNGSDIATETGLAGKFGLITGQIEKLLKAKAYDWISANLLNGLRSNFLDFSERALIVNANQLDFDSAIPGSDTLKTLVSIRRCGRTHYSPVLSTSPRFHSEILLSKQSFTLSYSYIVSAVATAPPTPPA
jgi:hypothetical protein